MEPNGSKVIVTFDVDNSMLIEKMKKKMQKTNTPSKWKNLIFIILSSVLPFVFLFFIEVGLRICNYGKDVYLIHVSSKYPDFYSANKDVSFKYFTNDSNATIGIYEVFRKEKQPNTIRIFVLGESTAVGFPYFHNGSFHRMLTYRLEQDYPKKKFEIINFSLTAISSYALADFARQLVNYQPDAILVCAGHNEYYGALGVGSTSSLGNSPFLIRCLMRLREFRIVQLVYKIGSVFRRTDRYITDQRENLMHRMAADQSIAFGSKKYQTGIKQFDENMEQLLTTFKKSNVPVFLSTLVANEKDFFPMKSISNQPGAFGKQLVDIRKFIDEQNFEKAESLCNSALAADSTNADACFYLGKIAFAQSKYPEAARMFGKARDFDALRFRAPTKINQLIREKAGRFNNVRLVDCEKLFRDHSPGYIIGDELVLEHVHPNLNGYFLIQEAFYKELSKSGILGPENKEEKNWTLAQMPITKVDSLYGLYCTWLLKEGWPFYDKTIPKVNKDKTFEENVAGGLAVKQYSWGDAMNSLFKYYIEKKDERNALKITEGLVLEFPYDYRMSERAMKIAANLDDYHLSNFYALKADELCPTGETAKQLFINYLKMDQPENALPYIVKAQSANSPVNLVPLKALVSHLIVLKKQLNESIADVNLLNGIAECYYQIGNYAVADRYNSQSLKQNSTGKEALALQRRLKNE
jgi:tetratricopeptide (TPR) repeat protein